MRRLEVTASTLGQANPAHVGEGNYYRRFGSPEWVPNHPDFRDDDTPRRATGITRERAKRLAEFGRLRAQGLSIPEAGGRLQPPVKAKTAYSYEREWRAMQGQQREATS